MIQPEISEFLQNRIDACDFPSAVYLVWEKGEIRYEDALGSAVVADDPIPAKLNTIYDLASLTKVLATGLLAAKLVGEGRISLDEDLGRWFSPAVSGPSMLQAVAHSSGYPAWRPFYAVDDAPKLGPGEHLIKVWDDDREAIRDFVTDMILRTERNRDQGVVYSDLNFILIGRLIEEVHGLRVATIIQNEIVDRLGLPDMSSGGTGSKKLRTAASENGNAFERQTCIDGGFLKENEANAVLRSDLIWGEVHDGNAYFLGGVAGHAGLFGTAADVLKIAQQFLPSTTKLLKPETCELFTTNFTPNAVEDRSFAFQLASTAESTAGTLMSPQSFGHLGFTGTSLWIDPISERIFILLTNRTHNHPLPFVNINSVRRRFHDLAIEALERDS